MQKNVAVIFGGRSCENEVSIITGTMSANLLRGQKYAVYPVYIAQGGEMYTGEQLFDIAAFRAESPEKKWSRAAFIDGFLCEVKGRRIRQICKVDCALNCCHGMGGEDGTVAGVLRLNGIPDASPDMAASAVFMDKAITKLIAKALGVKAAPFFRIAEGDFRKRGAMALRAVEERLGYPVIVKPARQGSSIGVTVAEDRARLSAAIEAGFCYDSVLIAEKYLAGSREINCAAYRSGDEIVVSECEEPKTEHKILTFADKYLEGGKERSGDFPAKISKASADLIKAYTKLLYRRMNVRGVVRADYLLCEGEVYFNEMNTVPGSLAWYLFCDKLADFSQVLSALIEQGICEYREAAGKTLLKNSGVLGGFSGGGKRRGS